jgi:oligoendopeptidase F
MSDNIKTNWDLTLLYKSENEFEEDINKSFLLIDTFLTKYEMVDFKKINVLMLKTFLEEEDSLSITINKPFYYMSYLTSLDTQNQELLKKQQKIGNEYNNKFQDRMVNLSDKISSIGYEKLIKLSNNKKLKNYKNRLFNVAQNIKYRLDPKIETALLKTNDVISYGNKIFNELSNSFTYIIDGVEYTPEEVTTMWHSQNEDVRKKALDVIYDRYKQKDNKIIFGNLYSMNCMDTISSMKIKNITDDVMIFRNIREEMDTDVVNNMIENVKNNYHLYQRFLKIKAKFLKKDVLEAHDLYAPINLSGNVSTIPFDEGLNLYLEVIKKFDSDFYNYSKKMVNEGRLDVFPKKNKRGGAFSSSDKSIDSFILLNYTDTFNDVSTLAHEYGHSIHSYYYNKQNYTNAGVSLCLAETASIFNETIVRQYILENNLKTKEEKVEFVMSYLDSIFGSIYRQILYTSFEKRAHESFLNNVPLTYEDYDKIWQSELDSLYGNTVKDNHKLISWQRIPHIYNTPFYCYSYTFGNLLSFYLYNMYNKMDKSKFKKMYKNILESGCSKRPYDLLIENGIDIKSENFYTNSFEIIENFITFVESI